MAARFQIVIDSTSPQRLVRFWTTALGYVIERPPAPYEGWNAYWRSIGVPDEELDEGSDLGEHIVDPEGSGPRIWFQRVPETKTIKNRWHIDISASGGRELSLGVRRERVLAEAERLRAAGATFLQTLEEEGLDHFAVAMRDPEGNEFDIN
jgi:catechol 2,3-dioxygenase-like lactoylglutathione lyase family enzyme